MRRSLDVLVQTATSQKGTVNSEIFGDFHSRQARCADWAKIEEAESVWIQLEGLAGARRENSRFERKTSRNRRIVGSLRRLSDVGAPCFDVHGIDGLTGRHEQPVSFRTAKADVATDFG